MNSIEDLVSHGIGISTAEKMIEDYKSRLGQMNGIYEIIDIRYDFSVKGKIVTLKCSYCGDIIARTLITRRNKWSELIKDCGNCRQERNKL